MVDRRTLLKIAALMSTSFVLPSLASTSRPKVVVVGAGIIGAASAYYLTKAGAQVTIIDKLGIASHSSRGTFAWLNATWAKQPKSYHHFNQLGIAAWKDIQQTLDVDIRFQGSIEWFATDQRNQTLRKQIKEQQEWGEPAIMLNANQVRAREPMIKIDDKVNAAFSPNDGALDPVAASFKFIKAAIKLGAESIIPCHAIETIVKNDRAIGVNTSQGPISADHVLICAGADEQSIETLSGMRIPQRSTPGIIALTKPIEPIVKSIVAAPGVHLHQRNDGVVVLGEQAGPPNGEAHEMRLEGRPNDFPSKLVANQHGERILNDAKRFFPALEKAQIDNAYIGWRPLPLDGHPVIGSSSKIKNTYLAFSHSGVSLAPLIAKLVTKELLTTEKVASLEAYRPEREFSQVIRY